MAKIYLDTNYFIDIVEHRSDTDLGIFTGHTLYISALSLHILIYVYKYKIPNAKLRLLLDQINLVDLGASIADKALIGPTTDFEDNIQLHSSAAIEAEIFLTKDKKLSHLGFFGKAQMVNQFPAPQQ